MFDFVFIDNGLVSKRSASISVFDGGFLYGDGIFETLRSHGGKVFALDRHLDRLFASARALRYELGFDRGYVEKAVYKTLKKNLISTKDAYIKIIISRGQYKNRLDIYSAKKPRLIIMASKLKEGKNMQAKGSKLISSTIRREPFTSGLYRHKLLNYLENILAKNQALRSKADDAIFLTKDRYILECSTSNIFCVRGRKVLTPPLNQYILAGITRETVIDICRKERIRLAERKIHYSDLIRADEVFITNSLIGLRQVSDIDIHPIGKGLAGPVTSMLRDKYYELARP